MTECLTIPELEALCLPEATEDLRHRASRHMAECPRCRAELETRQSERRLMTDIRRACSDDTVLRATAATNGATLAGMPRAPRIEGYEILGDVKRGAQGVVYRAVQRATKRMVALKVLIDDPYSPGPQRFRFEREIDLVAGLEHPYIVRVYDSGVADDGRCFYAMEYIDGRPLDRYTAEVRLDVRATLRLFVKIASAVQYAHQRGVIHRDLKPGNILIDREGEPHVLDFGLAKLTELEARRREATVTMTGEFMGTLAYASPEQTRGDSSDIDVRSDVYSLGVLLYEMLTGQFPYDVSGQLAEVLRNIVEAEPRPPSALRSRIDDEVDTIVLKALAKDKERRYQSVAALCDDVERCLQGEPIDAKRDSTWYVLRTTLRKHRLTVAFSGMLLLLLVGFGMTMLVLYARAEREARKAEQVHHFLESILNYANSREMGPQATLLDALAQAEPRIPGELYGQPGVEAAVRRAIANCYASLWRWEPARRNLLVALDLSIELYGDDSTEAANCLASLGHALTGMGRPDEAVAPLRRALEIRIRRLGSADATIPATELELAAALWRSGSSSWAEAERLLAHATRYYRAVQPPDRLGLARCAQEWASLRAEQGRWTNAVWRFMDAIRGYRLSNSQSEPDYLLCIDGAAQILALTGEYDEAARLTQEALARRPLVYGGSWKAALLWRQGSLHLACGELDDAEQNWRSSLALWARTLADASKLDAEVDRIAAGLELAAANLAGPAPYEDFLQIAENERVRRFDRLQVVLDLADLLIERGQLERAQRFLQQARGLTAQNTPVGRVQTLRAVVLEARLSRMVGQTEAGWAALVQVAPHVDDLDARSLGQARAVAEGLLGAGVERVDAEDARALRVFLETLPRRKL